MGAGSMLRFVPHDILHLAVAHAARAKQLRRNVLVEGRHLHICRRLQQAKPSPQYCRRSALRALHRRRLLLAHRQVCRLTHTKYHGRPAMCQHVQLLNLAAGGTLCTPCRGSSAPLRGRYCRACANRLRRSSSYRWPSGRTGGVRKHAPANGSEEDLIALGRQFQLHLQGSFQGNGDQQWGVFPDDLEAEDAVQARRAGRGVDPADEGG